VQDLQDTILDLIITGSRRGLNAKRPHLLPQAQRRPAHGQELRLSAAPALQATRSSGEARNG
jgi:hypothetical protein